jgi:D-proline reductase (dithiol) PrdB
MVAPVAIFIATLVPTGFSSRAFSKSRRWIEPLGYALLTLSIVLQSFWIAQGGVHLRDQEPYDVEGDNTWRLLPGDVQASQLMVTHDHYDHRDADQDINCVFPIDRLRELAPEGIIAGVSDKHLGFMGYSQQLRDIYERAAPEMAKIILHSKADAVLLTAG